MADMDSFVHGNNSAYGIMNGHSNMMNNYWISEHGIPQNSHLLRLPAPFLDTGFTVDWSAEEQCILDEALIRFANEPLVMKYVKIAGLLKDKTTRDVAMRCNWMKRKRQKQKQPNAEKSMTTRKEVPSKENLPSAAPVNMASYSHVPHSTNQTKQFPHEAYHGPFQNALQQNLEYFTRIDDNLSTFKLQENLDLFRNARNNIISILNNLTNVEGTSRPMPPLPVSIDEKLANAFLHDQTEARMLRFSNGSF